jgi:hypothetical protein
MTHVRLVPLPEGGSVNVDNGRLDKSLGTEQLVVGRVVSLGNISLGSTIHEFFFIPSSHFGQNSQPESDGSCG